MPITIVSLDPTNRTPLTRPFLDRLARQPSAAFQLAAQSWWLVVEAMGNDQYYFWGTLTAATLLDHPSVVRTERLKIRVITTGASQGRTVVDVALDTNCERVEQMLLTLLGK